MPAPMTFLAFGRTVLAPDAQACVAALTIIGIPPPRFRGCTAQVVMRGADSVYEDFVVLELSGDKAEACAAFAVWITLQMTRRGFALVEGLSPKPQK